MNSLPGDGTRINGIIHTESATRIYQEPFFRDFSMSKEDEWMIFKDYTKQNKT